MAFLSTKPLPEDFEAPVWLQYLRDKLRYDDLVFFGVFNQRTNEHWYVVIARNLLEEGMMKSRIKEAFDKLIRGEHEEAKGSELSYDPGRSKSYRHSRDFFDALRGGDPAIYFIHLFGDPWYFDNYISKFDSQKNIQNQFEQQSTFEFVFIKAATDEEAIPLTTAQLDTFKPKVEQGKPKVTLLEQYNTMVFLQIQCEGADSPEAYMKKVIKSTLEPLASEFEMIIIQDDTREVQTELFTTSKQPIICSYGTGELYNEYKKYAQDKSIAICELIMKGEEPVDDDNIIEEEPSQITGNRSRKQDGRSVICKLHSKPTRQRIDAFTKDLKTKFPDVSNVQLLPDKTNSDIMLLYIEWTGDKLKRRQFAIKEHRGWTLIQKHFPNSNPHVLSQYEKTTLEKSQRGLSIEAGDDEEEESCQVPPELTNVSQGQEEGYTSNSAMLIEFHKLVNQKQIKTVNDYRKLKKDDPLLLDKAYAKKGTLQEMINQFIGSTEDSLPSKATLATLNEYVARHPVSVEDQLTEHSLRKAGLLQVMWSIGRVILQVGNLKRGTVIMHGPPNTGKSTLQGYLADIFITSNQREASRDFDMQPVFGEYKFQVVLYEEAALLRFFSPGKLQQTKLLFERKGTTLEAKCQQPRTFYAGAAVIISCNCIPWIENAIEREAVYARIYACLLDIRHKDTESFPFIVEQTAEWFLRAYNDGTLAIDYQDDANTDIIFARDAQLHDQPVEEPPYPIIQQLLKKRPLQAIQPATEEEVKGEVDSPLQTTECIQVDDDEKRSVITNYYLRTFPGKKVEKIYWHKFRNRGFAVMSFPQPGQKQTSLRRNLNFISFEDLEKYLAATCPYRVFTCPIYAGNYAQEDRKCKKRDPRSSPIPVMTELQFDIDLNDLDYLRTCCQGKTLCQICWNKFACPMIKAIHEFLVHVLGYSHILWTFSGGKGAHCRVFDDKVRKHGVAERKIILKDLKDWASKKGVAFKVDEQVTTDSNRLLGLPFSVHGDTLRILVPFDPAKPEELIIDNIPTAYDERSALQPYIDILYQTFIIGMTGVYSKPVLTDVSVTGQRDPFTGENTWVEGTEHEELWQQIKENANDFKAMLFWRQVRKGDLKFEHRRELINFFRWVEMPKEQVFTFFEKTMGQVRYLQKDNNMIGFIHYIYKNWKPSVQDILSYDSFPL